MASSLLIKNGHVLDLGLPFQPADVLIQDGRIAQVGRGFHVRADRTIEASGKVVMPGLINAHTHSGQILDRGLADNMPLDEWMLCAAYGGPPLSARELGALAAWSAVVQLKTGCTACLDHPFVPAPIFDDGIDAIMQGYADTGFRAAVAVAVSDMDFFSTLPLKLMGAQSTPSMPFPPPSTQDQVDAARRFLQRWQGRSERVRPFIGPSAPQRCTDELLAGCFDLSREFEAGVHTHVLEARSQWFACHERFGTSPVDYFQRQGWLSPRLSCAHGVWLSGEDMRQLAGAGSAVAHNPVSNLRLGSGIANLQRMLASKLTVALGADGAASNDNQNMWEVLKLAGILHKVYGPRSQWVTAHEALRLCLQGGASVLGQRLGAIAPGCEADLVVLGGTELFLHGKEQMIAGLVFGELGQSVETVVVAGEVVLDSRRLTKIDEAALRREVDGIVAKVEAAMPRRAQLHEERKDFLHRMLSAVEAAGGGPEGILVPGR